MEWLLLLLLVLAATALVAFSDSAVSVAEHADELDLRAERQLLLADLRDLDEDFAAGRISAADRQLGRRALGPRLRALSEALRATGDETQGRP